MRIGIFGGGFKPYHKGHHAIVERAAAENDRVILFVSTKGRSRKGEFAISGEEMLWIWKQQLERIMPQNVEVRYVDVPIQAMWGEVGAANEALSSDTYVIYCGEEDLKRFSDDKLQKYWSHLFNSGQIEIVPTPRLASGTEMRRLLASGDKEAFISMLPDGVDGDTIYRELRRSAGLDERFLREATYEMFGITYDPFPGDMFGAIGGAIGDVIKTGFAGVQDVASAAFRGLETVYQGLPTLVVPFVAANYDRIRQADQQRHQELMSKYGDVFARNDEAFKNEDLQAMALMINPTAWFTTQFASQAVGPIGEKAASAMLELLDALTGRNVVHGAIQKMRDWIDDGDRSYDNFRSKVLKPMIQTKKEGFINKSYLLTEKEDEKREKQISIEQALKAFMNLPQIKGAIEESEILDSMQKDAEAVVSAKIKGLQAMGEKIANASLADLQATAGKDMIPNDVEMELKKLPPDEYDRAVDSIAAAARVAGLESLINSMNAEQAALVKGGVPKNSSWIRAYQRAINGVEELRRTAETKDSGVPVPQKQPETKPAAGQGAEKKQAEPTG